MEISKEQIEKIASLARLELKDEEKKIYQKQFKDILGFVDTLQEVNVPVLDFLGLDNDSNNQLREDRAVSCEEDERLIAINQSPEIEFDQFKVGRVL